MLSIDQKLQVWALCGYEPYKEQLEAHACEERVVLVAGGERAGKSRWTAAETTAALVPEPTALFNGEDLPSVRIAIAAESYDESRKEFSYLIDDLKALGMLKPDPSTPKTGKWIVESTTGGYVESISLKEGGQELTSRGEPYDVVAVVEAGRVSKQVYTDARLRVAEKRGRVLLSGTIWAEFGWYPELWQILRGPNNLQGKAFSLPSWANRRIYPGGRDDPEIVAIAAQLSEEEFARRLGARVLPSPARIYRSFDEAEHVLDDAPYDPEGVVHLTVDPGFFPSKYACLAIQPRLVDLADHDEDETDEEREATKDEREVLFVLDELWEQNITHQEAISRVKGRYWWDTVVRVFGGHETTQHHAAESTEEVWRRETGLAVTVCGRLPFKYHGFMRTQTFLDDPLRHKPRLYVDKRCRGLIHEFTHYERRTNRFHEVVSDDPPQDAEDDALDALTNYIVNRHGLADTRRVEGRRGSRDRPARG